MKEITRYIREQESQAGKPVCLSITTNGTMLDQSMYDFLGEENIDLCVSMDGPAHVHNLNRVYKNGQGSFAKVVRNLQKALGQLDSVQVNAVYGPETIDFLPESVSFFIELGVPVIHLNPSMCASWRQDIYSKLRENYMQIANYYVQRYLVGQECAVDLIDSKIILYVVTPLTMSMPSLGPLPDSGLVCPGNCRLPVGGSPAAVLDRHRMSRGVHAWA
jgi:sulfatase maturation enzyme AslB (radical SAM superfamily)